MCSSDFTDYECISRCFVSNDVEFLSELFIQNISFGDPFNNNLVFVEGNALSSWLEVKIANRLGVCFLEAYPFKGMLKKIFQLSGIDPSNSPFSVEFFWKVYSVLVEKSDIDRSGLLECCVSVSDQIRKSILCCIDVMDSNLPDIVKLCYKSVFIDSCSVLSVDGLMSKIKKDFPRGKSSLCLFGVSYVSKFESHVISVVKQFVSVDMYAFSPCASLWDASLSTRSAKYVDCCLSEHCLQEANNRMIYSMGRLGKFFISNIEDIYDNIGFVYSFEEKFFDYVGDIGFCDGRCSSELSLLSRIKRDILTNKSCLCVSKHDDTVSFILSNTPMRQVQLSLNIVKNLLSSGARLDQIVLLCPDIKSFGGIIRFVFSSGGIDVDVNFRECSPGSVFYFLRRCWLFLYDNADVYDVLYFLTDEDVRLFCPLDDEQREFIIRLIRKGCSDVGMNMLCILTFLKNLMKNAYLSITGYDVADAGTLFSSFSLSADSVSIFVNWIGDVLEPFLSIYKRDVTIEDMVSVVVRFLCIADKYCDHESDVSLFRDMIEKIPASIFHQKIDPKTFWKCFLDRYSDKRYLWPNMKLMCGNIGSVGIIPFDYAVVIGVDEDSFPQMERRCDCFFASPSHQDEDRFSLLRVLIVTKKRIFFIYSRSSVNGSCEPCDSVKDILQWVEIACGVAGGVGSSGCFVSVQPTNEFDDMSFSGSLPWKSCFINEFGSGKSITKTKICDLYHLPISTERAISIWDLNSFCFSPGLFYLRNRLGFCSLQFRSSHRSVLSEFSVRKQLVLGQDALENGFFRNITNDRFSVYDVGDIYRVNVSFSSVNQENSCRFESCGFYVLGSLVVSIRRECVLLPSSPRSYLDVFRQLPCLCLSVVSCGLNKVMWLDGACLDISANEVSEMLKLLMILFVNGRSVPLIFDEYGCLDNSVMEEFRCFVYSLDLSDEVFAGLHAKVFDRWLSPLMNMTRECYLRIRSCDM